MQLLRAAGGGL